MLANENSGTVESRLESLGEGLEALTLVDRIVEQLGASKREEQQAVMPMLLPCLSPAVLSAQASMNDQLGAISILRAVSQSLQAPHGHSFALPAKETSLPRKVRRKSFSAAGIVLTWSRSKGLAWQGEGIRACADVFSLEVQDDLGLGAAFCAGHPARPRIFRVADMQPTCISESKEVAHFVLERDFPLRVNSEGAGLRRLHWKVHLRLDRANGALDSRIELGPLPPGQRVRLLIPLPFYPRPTRYGTYSDAGVLEQVERNGPFDLEAMQGMLTAEDKSGRLEFSGSGLREVELYPCKNDFVLAVTLLRSRVGGPDHVEREFRLHWHPRT